LRLGLLARLPRAIPATWVIPLGLCSQQRAIGQRNPRPTRHHDQIALGRNQAEIW